MIKDLLNTPPVIERGRCTFRPWYEKLTEDERNAITASFDNEDWTTSAIVRILQDAGCPSSETTIRTHRKFACQSCNRKDGR